MRSDRNVYVLGAGFSADAGVPTVPHFLQAAREHFDAPRSPLAGYLEPHYEAVLQYRQRAKQSRDCLRLNLDDIETLFSLIDMNALAEPRSTGKRKSADSIKHVIADTVTVARRAGNRMQVAIEAERLNELRVPPEMVRRFAVEGVLGSTFAGLGFDQYEFFAALVGGLFEPRGRDVQDAVISFNYDTVLEDAIWALGGDVDYGASYVQAEGRRGEGRPSFVTKLFKLHGSSNWADQRARGVRARIHRSYRDFGEVALPLVVPPTWKKGTLEPLFSEVWKGARDALAQATRICIIGYSMPVTDPFFHHLMASALGDNNGLYRLDVVDLRPRESQEYDLERRYRDLFAPLDGYGRLHFHLQGFKYFLASQQTPFSSATGRGEGIHAVQLRG